MKKNNELKQQILSLIKEKFYNKEFLLKQKRQNIIDLLGKKINQKQSKNIIVNESIVKNEISLENLQKCLTEIFVKHSKEINSIVDKTLKQQTEEFKKNQELLIKILIKNNIYNSKKEFIYSKSEKQKKEDISTISSLATVFLESIISFFTKLQRLTHSVKLNPEHYGTPQAVILIDPRTMKSLDPKEIGLGTMQQVINQSMAGRSSEVAIRGANTINDGQVSIPTAGTRVQLPDVPCSKVYIQSHPSNTGEIVVGGANVIAESVNRRGLAIFSSQWTELSVNNLNKIYIDGTIDNDKINYIYEYIS